MPPAAQKPSAAGAERTEGIGTAGDPLITRLNALEQRVEKLAALLQELTGESLT